jgi:hypothetical protein
MRYWFGAVAAAGLLLQVGTLAAAETSTARMLSFGEAAPAGDQPVILRGAAVAPKPAPEVVPSYQRYQVAAGRRLWFFDPVTQDIRSCINRRTSTVGVRVIRCVPGSLSGYGRTFGPAFQP